MRKIIHSGIGFGTAFMMLSMYVIFKAIYKINIIPCRYREFLILPIVLIGGLLFIIGVLIYNKILKIITDKLSNDLHPDLENKYISCKVQSYGNKADLIIFIVAVSVYAYFNFW